MTKHNWKDMKPDDGYFAALNIVGEVKADLVFGLYVNSSLVKTTTIASRQWPSARVIGDLKRKLIFWEGFAEHLNAGGNGFDLIDDFNDVITKFQGTLVFEGWSYFDTGVNTNGNRVHEFINDDQAHVAPMRFVRWVRGEFIDYKLTEHDMLDTDNHGRNDTPTQADRLRVVGGESAGQTDS